MKKIRKTNFIILIATFAFLFKYNLIYAGTAYQDAYEYNEKGIKLMQQGNFADAIANLKTANSYSPQDERIRHNLSNALSNYANNLLGQGYNQGAIEQFEQALYYDPNNTFALFKLAMLYYNDQKLIKAKEYFQRLRQLNSSIPQVEAMLQKLNNEINVESDLRSLDTIHFIIVVSPGADINQVSNIRIHLENAYSRISALLNHYPSRKTTAIIYPNPNAAAAFANTPHWTAAVFDGKLRIPTFQAGADDSIIAKIIYHEFAHALLFDLVGNRCPSWLNEGFAVNCEESISSKDPRFYKAYVEKFGITPLSQIPADFSSIGNINVAHIIYMESFFAVKFIINKAGWSGFNNLLKELNQGSDINSALLKIIGINWDGLNKEVLYYIKSNLGLSEVKLF